MNRAFCIVFNRALGVWQVVSEITRNQGKGLGARGGLRLFVLLPLAAWASLGWAANAPPVEAMRADGGGAGNAGGGSPAASMFANQLPTGGTVSAGSGSIAQSGAAMTITQTTQNLAINWQSFDIGANASVTFLQPNATAIALNRVLGGDTTHILGQLKGNGQVWVLNPNGVLFGSSAQVNVGGLVASTLGLSDADFMAGKRSFTGSGGSVVNQGSLNGGYVALLGENVRNEGTITARLGTAALAAGNRVTLDFNGDQLLNVQVDEGALHALADNRGLIQADGGSVLMTARARDALLDTAVNNTGIIRARTVANRNGRILLLGDMAGGTVNVAGTLDASAPDGGNGGFIETSAAHVKVADSAVITTKSAGGQNGKWLIDPTDFTVAKSGGDMTGAALTNALANGDVQIQSTAGASGTGGDVNIKDTVSWNQNTLTLDAQRDINVYSAMNASGTAGLFFKYGQADAGGSYNIYAPVNLASTSSFRTQSGSAGDITHWTIITSLGSETDVTGNAGTTLQGIWGNLGGNFVLGADIDASSTAGWNGGLGFTPLGGNNPGAINNPAFSGNFDGLGHVIDGLTINRPDIHHIGLFGEAQGASFANLGLSNVSISGNTQVGGLVGRSGNVTIYNSYVTGTVTGLNSVGGVIGSDIFPRGSSSLINVYSSADVTATTPGTGTGTLSGIAGGLVGGNVNLVENSYSTGNVTGGNYVGGLVGYANEATVKNSYFAGTITVNGTPYTSGAILGGRLSQSASLYNTLTNVYWNTDLTGTSLTANGNASLSSLTNATGLTTAQMRNAANWTGFDFVTTPSQNGWLWTDGAMPLLASEWSSYIRNAHQLQLMALDLSADYTLANDIDASATNGAAGDVWYGGSFSPIGTAASKFTGSFDGQGHVINGLTINRGTQDNIGLFGYAGDGAHFSNIGLSNASITGRAFVGTLLGQGGNTDAVAIDNAWSSGTVTSTSTSQTQGAIGGLVGGMSGTIANSHSSATVTGHNRVGGLVGQMSVDSNANKIQQISNSYATGDVSATFGYGGGLVGRNFARIANSYATGDVSGGTVLGGLVGYGSIATYWNNQQDPSTQDSYLNVYASGNVTGTGNDVGGLFGLTQGLVGVHNAFATGNVVGAKNVGGLIGRFSDGGSSSQQASLWSVYTQGGTVTGQDNVGGLIGSSGWVHVTNSYSASGLLTATDSNAKLGGLIGGNNTALSANIFIFDNGVWNIETTGTDFAVGDNAWGSFFITAPSGTQYLASGHTVGATTAQMMTVEPYAVSGFNNGQGGLVGYSIVTAANAAGNDYSQLLYSNNIYFLYEGQTYPLLRAFLQKVTVNADLSGANKTYDGQIASGTVGSYTTSIPVDASLILGNLSYATNSANAGTYTTSSGLNVSGGLYSGQLGYEITYSPTTSLTIGKASATVTANSGTFTYNGQTQNVAGFTVTGLVNGEDKDVLDSVLETGGSGRDAGSYAHTVSGSDNNYDLTFVDGALTIDKASLVIGTDDVTKTYDGTLDAAGNAIILGGQLFGSDSLSGGSFAFTDKNAGTGKTVTVGGVTLDDGNGGGNYAVTYVANTSSTIDKAALTVGTSDVTKTYDGTLDAAGNAIVLGGQLFGSDSISGGDFAFTDKNAGTGKTVTVGGVTLDDGNGGGNYDITYVANTSSTIGKASATVTANSATTTYNGQTQSVAGYTVTGLVNGEDESVIDALAEAGGSGRDAGSYAHTVSGSDGNYDLTFVDGTLTIGKAALTVTANDASKTYDGIAWSGGNGVQYSGFVNGEDSSVLSGALVYGGSSQGAVNAGNYTISASGLGSGNYDIVYVDGNLTISPKLLTLIIGNLTGEVRKTYDGTTTATLDSGNFLLTGWVGGDGATVTQTTGQYDNANAGIGKTVTVYLSLTDFLANAGTDLSNYILPTQISGNVGIIDKASATVIANSATFTYNGQTQGISGYTVTGLVNGENDSVLDSVQETGGSGRNAGSYAHSVSGSDNNYDLTFVDGALTIDKASLVIGTDDVTKTYDGTLDAAGNAIVLGGQLYGDDAISGGDFAFTDKNAGSGKTVTVGGVALDDGNGGGNYDVTYVANTSSTIDKASATVIANSGTFTYNGQTQNVAGFTATGLVNGENESVLASLAEAGGSGRNAGSYAHTVSGSDGNYDLTFVDGALTIDKAAITIGTDDVTKTYDGTLDAAGNAIILGGQLFGSDSISGGDFAFTDKNAGTGKTVTVGGVTLDDGNGGGNYAITYADNTTSTILQKVLTVSGSFDAEDKPWDGSDGASIGRNALALDGVVAGDALAADWRAAFSDAAIGQDKTVTLRGSALSGGDSGNYRLDLAGAPTAVASILGTPVGLEGARYAGATRSAQDEARRTPHASSAFPEIAVLQCGQNLPAQLTKDCR